MKLPGFLVAGSLALNLLFAALFAVRPSLAPPAFRDYFSRHFDSDKNPSSKPAQTRAPRITRATPLWPTLATDDLPSLIARLRSAGFPPSIIRAIIIHQVNARYEARIRALQAPDPNLPFWKQGSTIMSSTEKRYLEANQLQRERSRVVRDLLKDDPTVAGEITSSERRTYGNLSRGQIDAIRRIEDDYA
ncbi:MAG: hypothetical protein ABIO94_13780, partial [Opitutaceae bacterium]